jgi:hypothetical protein
VTPTRYQSYGLRFELKRPGETVAVFRQRINRLERVEAKLPETERDPLWIFGSQSVAAGSLHCDVWIGSGADLAARDVIAVHPVGGWWRDRPHLARYDSRGRYCLVVSIASEDAEVELYTEIANLIGLGIDIEIGT